MAISYFSTSAYAEYGTGVDTYLLDFDAITLEGEPQLLGLIVTVALFGAGTVTSVIDNPNGPPPTQDLSLVRADTNGSYRSEIWYLQNMISGSHEITVNFSTTLSFAIWAGSFQYFGGVGANGGATGTGTPASKSITTLYDNSIVFAHLASNTASGITDAAGQDRLHEYYGALATTVESKGGLVTPPASAAMQFNSLGVADVWAMSCVELLSITQAPPPISIV